MIGFRPKLKQRYVCCLFPNKLKFFILTSDVKIRTNLKKKKLLINSTINFKRSIVNVAEFIF